MRRPRLCILATHGTAVRHVLMSRAMAEIQRCYEIRVLSPFTHTASFRARFAHLEGLDHLVEPRRPRSVTLLHDLRATLFYKLSASATHRDKLSRIKRDPTLRRLRALARRFASPRLYTMAHRMLVQQLRRSESYRLFRRYFREHGIDTFISASPLHTSDYAALLAAKDLTLATVAADWR